MNSKSMHRDLQEVVDHSSVHQVTLTAIIMTVRKADTNLTATLAGKI